MLRDKHFLSGIGLLILLVALVSVVYQTRLQAAKADTPAVSPAIHYSPPLIITKGGDYTGNWESTDPNVPAVTIQTAEAVTISNSNVRGLGNLIQTSGPGGFQVTIMSLKKEKRS